MFKLWCEWGIDIFASTVQNLSKKTFDNSLCGEQEKRMGIKPRFSVSKAEFPPRQTKVFETLIIGLK